ncbi:MAG TPA: hypothetical protein VNK43_01410 [Gemmatimonadales bacterium]|nr:hypothetical protein [Gemmatimonadales bacterium]
MRRLALLLAAWAFAACGGDTGSAGPAPPVDTVVTPPPADTAHTPTVTIDVTPATATVVPGGTRAFVAVVRGSDGASVSLPVVWSAAGGSIAPDGTFTADSVPGTFAIVATSGGAADTAMVTISAPAAPPQPGSGAECSAPRAEWVWCDDFDRDRLGAYFEYRSDGGSFVRVNGVGRGGSFGMRARFAPRQVSAGALHLAVGKTPQAYFRPADAGTANYRELYWRFYLRHQPGWVGGGGDKLTRAFSFASSTSWAQAMIAHVWSGGSTHRNYLVIDPASGTDPPGKLLTTTYNDFARLRWLGRVVGVTPIFDAAHVGKWYCIETHVRLNDPGQANGVFELWIDGRQEARKTGMNWVGSFTGYGLNSVYLENYWNAGSPAVQERYFDNFVVSTQRIGC